MSRSSFASFHLTGIKTSSGKVMTSSVDRLFENDADVFHSSNFGEFQGLPSIQETTSAQSKSPEPSHASSLTNKSIHDNNLPSTQQTGRDSPNTSTAKSSRRDSLSEKILPDDGIKIQQQIQPPPAPTSFNIPIVDDKNYVNKLKQPPPVMAKDNTPAGGGELFEKFQKQKLFKENITNNNSIKVNGTNNNEM